ncbi:hypothetical protein TSAR_007947, partial [Trichomalopsis sarcophagae]
PKPPIILRLRYLRATACFHVSLSARVVTFVSGFLTHISWFRKPAIFRPGNHPCETTAFENHTFSRHGTVCLTTVNSPDHGKTSDFPGTARHIPGDGSKRIF